MCVFPFGSPSFIYSIDLFCLFYDHFDPKGNSVAGVFIFFPLQSVFSLFTPKKNPEV